MAPVYLMAPPPGQVRTPVNPPSSGAAVVPTGVATTAVACACVALRIFTRVHVVSGRLGWDDYLVLCALAFSVSFFFVGRHLYTVGAGLHMWDVLYSDYSPRFLQTTIGATLTYAISISFSKLSILAFYLRVSPDKTFRRAVYALIGVVVAYTVTYIFVIVLRCQPVAAAWDLSIQGGVCIEYLIPMMVLSIANIVIDLVVLLLPVKVIVPLQIPARQKVSLVLLFATGGFVCVAAIKRTIIMPPLMASPDYSWDLTEQFVWSFVEVNAGILCASLAALKPLFMRYLPVLIVSRLRSSADDSSAAAAAPSMAKHHPGGSALTAASSAADTLYGHPCEASSRDALPADDEARLWARKHAHPAAAYAAAEAKTDSDAVHSLGELYPGVQPPVYAVTGAGFDARQPQSPDGIKITKETLVTYGKRG